jgi:hypothetical protein
VKRLIAAGVLLVVGVTVKRQWPEIMRYANMRRM